MHISSFINHLHSLRVFTTHLYNASNVAYMCNVHFPLLHARLGMEG